jgi:hypothetical protein
VDAPPETAQALARGVRMAILCAAGDSNTEVGDNLGVTKQIVGKWRSRLLEKRFNGVLDEPRPGAPWRVTDVRVEKVITKNLESTLPAATHWITRSMAETVGGSQKTILKIWHAFGLQPHRTEAFRLSKDPLSIDKVRDIVGLYLNPPDRALVICVDEKSQIQVLDRTQPLLPLRPGQVERRTHDFVRHGTISLFAALDAKTGKVNGSYQKRHRAIEFRRLLDS